MTMIVINSLSFIISVDNSELYAQEEQTHRRQNPGKFQNARFLIEPRSSAPQARYRSRDDQHEGFRPNFHPDQTQVPLALRRNVQSELSGRRSDRRGYSDNHADHFEVHDGDLLQSPSGFQAPKRRREDFSQIHQENQLLQHGSGLRDSSSIKGLDYHQPARSPAYSSHSDTEEVDHHTFIHNDGINNDYQVPQYLPSKRPKPIYYKPNPTPPAYQRPKTFENPLLRGGKQNFGNEYIDNEPEVYVRETKRFAVSRNTGPSQPRRRNNEGSTKEGQAITDHVREFERNAQEYINKALKEASEAEEYAKEIANKVKAYASINKDDQKSYPNIAPVFAPANGENNLEFADNSHQNIPDHESDKVDVVDDGPVYQAPVYYVPTGKFDNNPRYRDVYPNVVAKPYRPVLDYPVHVRKGYNPRQVSGNVNVVANANPSNVDGANNSNDNEQEINVADNPQSIPSVNEGSNVHVVENAVDNNIQDNVKVVDNGEKVTFVDNTSHGPNNGVNIVESPANNLIRPGVWNQGPNSHLLRNDHQTNEQAYNIPTYYVPNGKFSNNPRFKDIYPNIKPNYGPLDYPVHVRKGYIPRRVTSNVIFVDSAPTQNVGKPVNIADNSQNDPIVNEDNANKVKVVENAVNNNEQGTVNIVNPSDDQNQNDGEKVTVVNSNPVIGSNNGVNVVDSPITNPNRPGLWNQGPNSHLLRNQPNNGKQINQAPSNFPYEKFGNNPRYKDLYPNVNNPNHGPFNKVDVVENAANHNQDKVQIAEPANVSNTDEEKVEFVNNEESNIGNAGDNIVGPVAKPDVPNHWNQSPDNSHLLRDKKPIAETKPATDLVQNNNPTYQRPNNVINDKFKNNPRYQGLNNNEAKPAVLPEVPVNVREEPQIDNTDTGAPGYMASPSNLYDDSENPDTVQNAYKSRPRYNGFRPYKPYGKRGFNTKPIIENSFYRNPQNFLPIQVVNGPTTIVGGPVTGFQVPDISPVFADVIALPDGTYIDKPLNEKNVNTPIVNKAPGEVKTEEEKTPQEIVPTVGNDLEKVQPSNDLDDPKVISVGNKQDQTPAAAETPNKLTPEKDEPVNEVPNAGPTTILGNKPATDAQVPNISPALADVTTPTPDKLGKENNDNTEPEKATESEIVKTIEEKLPQAATAVNSSEDEEAKSSVDDVSSEVPKTIPENSPVNDAQVPDISPAFADVIALPNGTYVDRPISKNDTNTPSDNEPSDTGSQISETAFINVIVQPDGTLVPTNGGEVLTRDDNKIPIDVGSLFEIIAQKFAKGKEEPKTVENGTKDTIPSTQDEKDSLDSTNVGEVSEDNNKVPSDSAPVETDKIDEKTEKTNVESSLTKESPVGNNLENVDANEASTESTRKRKHKKDKSRKHKKTKKAVDEDGAAKNDDLVKDLNDADKDGTKKVDKIESIETSKTDTLDGVNEKISKKHKHKKGKRKHRKGGKHSKNNNLTDGEEKTQTVDDATITEEQQTISKESDLSETVHVKKHKSKRSKNSEVRKNKKKHSKRNKGKKTETDDVVNDDSEVKSDKTDVLIEKDETKDTETLSKEKALSDEVVEQAVTSGDSKDSKGKRHHGKSGKDEKSTTERRHKKDKKSKKHKSKHNIDVTEQVDEQSTQEESSAVKKDQESSISEKNEDTNTNDIEAINSDVKNVTDDVSTDTKDKIEKVEDTDDKTSITNSDVTGDEQTVENTVDTAAGKKKPSDSNGEETEGDDENSGKSDKSTTKDTKSGKGDEERNLSEAKIIRKLTRHYKLYYPKRKAVSKTTDSVAEQEKEADTKVDEIKEKLDDSDSSNSGTDSENETEDDDQTKSDADKTKLKKHHVRSHKHKGKVSKSNNSEISSETELKITKKSKSKQSKEKTESSKLETDEDLEQNDEVTEDEETNEINESKETIKSKVSKAHNTKTKSTKKVKRNVEKTAEEIVDENVTETTKTSDENLSETVNHSDEESEDDNNSEYLV
ncbi:probable serine/threonine-protein kinase DDB_G0282963 [Trichoplusia ni]|uniref:Probable serine/threonine-protein kinase DDB_G0282963 n=1 Tax=Trichoplusia ni TaxID=7111 RepID=A0A7E5X553_TRINI|nr:probable serine/threonine-protein kinase DDB_G0282963 [Trichoplusia ni]